VALRIERCDSLAVGEEIKALFLRNDYPTFPTFFDRAYPYASSTGGSSWIARNGQGSVVGHLAAFPRTFRDGTAVVRAALLVDNLFDRAYRNFWSAVELCRRAWADLRQAGECDFAYTDPTLPAQPVLKAAGFTTVGALRRFVLPLHPLYVGLFRLLTPVEPLVAERLDTGAAETRVAEALQTLSPGARFRGERSLELYATRLGGDSIPHWQWLLLRAPSDPATAALALTARRPGEAVLRIVDLRWDEARASAASVVHAVARSARDEGFGRMCIVTLAESELARSLGRCGFIGRRDALPLVVHLSRQDAVLPPVRDWLLTYFDGSAW
jgi:hypothetical protein